MAPKSAQSLTGDTSADGTEPGGVIVLKWAWRHFSLEVDDFDSVEEAADAARWASDDGNESLMGVEVWDDSGHRYIPANEVFALAEARRPPEPVYPKFVALVEVAAPEGDKPGRMEWFTSLVNAERFIDKWRPILGERLSLRRVRQ